MVFHLQNMINEEEESDPYVASFSTIEQNYINYIEKWLIRY